MVTHRLGTVHHFHRILVLEHGTIVEEGTGAELLARGGAYARLFHASSRETSAPKNPA
jgi:ABC-type multidrug transport system fused ATPase/permease subunit